MATNKKTRKPEPVSKSHSVIIKDDGTKSRDAKLARLAVNGSLNIAATVVIFPHSPPHSPQIPHAHLEQKLGSSTWCFVRKIDVQ